jgi:hypothetical protein
MSWILGTIFALELHGIYRVRSSIQLSVVLAALAFSVGFAALRGFPARLRPSLTWGGRIFLPLLFGVLAGLVLLFVLAIVQAVATPGAKTIDVLLILFSLTMIGVALWKARDPRLEGRFGRAEMIVLATLLVGGSAWPQSAWLRYALGSAEGARTLAEEHWRHEEYERAAVFYQAACERDDPDACAKAASMSQAGLGSPASGRRARELIAQSCGDAEECESMALEQTSRTTKEMLLSRACDLGGKNACDRVTRIVLGTRCDNGDAYACSTLAEQAISTPAASPYSAADLWQKACNFGDRRACERAGIR